MRILLIFTAILSSIYVLGQNNITVNGEIKIRNYAPGEFKANPQVFDIAQDKRGVMYFANQRGVLEYDGVNWKTIPVKDKNNQDVHVFSLASDDNGKVYVGATNDFGYLEINKEGDLEYVSLRSKIQEDIDAFEKVIEIIVYNEKVYFQSKKAIFILKEGRIQTVLPESSFESLIEAEHQFYVDQDELGLFKLTNSGLKNIRDGAIFSDKNVYSVIEFADSTVVITGEHGLFTIDRKDNAHPLQEFEKGAFYSALKLSDNLLSIGSFSDGITVIDKNFKTVFKVGLESGLIDGNIKRQFLDKENNLWLATNMGISKVEIFSPIVSFGKKNGLTSAVESVNRFKNDLYIAAYDGVYYLNRSGEIIKHPNFQNDCYGIDVYDFDGDTICLVSEVAAVHQIINGSISERVVKGGPYMSIRSKSNKDIIYVAHYDKLQILTYQNSAFRPIGKINNLQEEIYNLILDKNGYLWLGTLKNGVFKIHEDEVLKENPQIEHFPIGKNDMKGASYLFQYKNDIIVGDDHGLHKYNGSGFETYNDFGYTFNKDKRIGVHRISEDNSGNIWMMLYDENNNFELGYSKLSKEGKFSWFNKDFIRYSEEIVHDFYHDNDGITWIGGPDGILRYDPTKSLKNKIQFNCLVRGVSYGKEIFNGNNKKNGYNVLEQVVEPELDYINNGAIEFNFSAATYISEENTEYSYILEGYDKDWSKWSKNTYKEYSPTEGTYTFKVKAKNIYGEISEVATYTFSIMPPWYRTMWAYLLYFVGAIGLIYLLIKLSLRRVKKQNDKLNAIVEERTAEVVAQKEEIEHQKEIVDEKNKDILDSIQYAKHIQNTILPNNEFIQSRFKDAFVMFKPKDIVSGDFYWVKEKKGKMLFAAVDCTGHGVPGAFVSIVGNNGLNRAINEFDLIQPAAILDKLTELVEESFAQQGENDVKDGMDIALCVWDPKTNVLEYAGANNPLWIIRNGEEGPEIMETKADKQPIGAFDMRKPFTNHTYNLQDGDRVFLFSDGYPDQFGGPKGKKFKYKPLKQLLSKLNGSSMEEHHQSLDKSFMEWMGEYEQIDDVCIIGVQF